MIFYSFSLKQRVLASKSATFDIHTDHELLFDHLIFASKLTSLLRITFPILLDR